MEPEHTSPTNAGEQSGGERRAPPPPPPPQQVPPRAAATTRPDFHQGRDHHPAVRIPEVSSEQRQSNFKVATSGLTTMAHQDVFLGKSKHKRTEWNNVYILYIVPEGFLELVHVTDS